MVFIPWEVLQAAGMHEEPASYISAGLLLVMAFWALVFHRTSMAQKSYYLTFFGESFRTHRFLLAFALFALAELVLAGVVVYLYCTSPRP